jgi:hypothetical protein
MNLTATQHLRLMLAAHGIEIDYTFDSGWVAWVPYEESFDDAIKRANSGNRNFNSFRLVQKCNSTGDMGVAEFFSEIALELISLTRNEFALNY